LLVNYAEGFRRKKLTAWQEAPLAQTPAKREISEEARMSNANLEESFNALKTSGRLARVTGELSYELEGV